jgi:hypothetical protein
MFATYPTFVVDRTTEFQRRAECSIKDALARRALESTGKATAVLPSPELIKQIFAVLPDNDWLNFEDLHKGCPGHEVIELARAAVWLSKFAILRSRVPAKTPQ